MLKKTIAIIFTLILLLNCTIIFSVASEEADPVINMGNSFLRYTSALIIRNSEHVYPQFGVVNEEERTISLSYNVSSSTTYPVETYCSFDFFGHNYGSLTITLTISTGEAFEGGAYILVGGRPVDNYSYTVSDNSYTYIINGNIPTHFEVGGIFDKVTPEVFNNNNYIVTLYSNAVFVPDYSNMSQDIINNQNQNTQDIIGNQNQNTQDIIDNENQLQQNEKDEANNAGNENANALIDALPHYEDGLKNAFNSLTSVLNYTGTECKWEFPALYMPEIPNVINRTQLTESQIIDFEYWISKIPQNILFLIQSLLTAALIIYCIKQFYDIIAEIFVNRGNEE